MLRELRLMVVGAVFIFGCEPTQQELPQPKKDEEARRRATQDLNDPKEPSTVKDDTSDQNLRFDLCGSIANAEVFSEGPAEPLVNDLCEQGVMDELRKEDVRYIGKDADKGRIVRERDLNDSSTAFLMNISLGVPTPPDKVFEMARTKWTDPVSFVGDGYEIDDKLQYEKVSDTGTGADFRFAHNEITSIVDVAFKGAIEFHILEDGKGYAYFIYLTEAETGMEQFRLLVFIGELREGISEIFATTDMRLNNGDEHNVIVKDLNQYFRSYQTRYYRNALKAGK